MDTDSDLMYTALKLNWPWYGILHHFAIDPLIGFWILDLEFFGNLFRVFYMEFVNKNHN